MGSSSEPSRDRLGVPFSRRHAGVGSVPPSGDGSGVRSIIAARYGDARAEAEPVENDEARDVVDTFDRREEPLGGRLLGEVTLCGSV